jgi:hypothetical protein
MATSTQLRQRVADLAGKRADLEKKLGDAQRRRAVKESEAAGRSASASRTSSQSMQRSYMRQAETAHKAVLTESTKIADLSKRIADVARDEGRYSKDLAAALMREGAVEARAAEKAIKEREAAERKRVEQRKADERRRHQERMADERRRREEEARLEQARLLDQATTATLLSESEMRLTKEIEAIRPPRRERLRVLYATATSHGDLRLDEEIRRVKAAVRAATHRDQVDIEHLPAATPADLLDGLTTFRPHVVHFSGHGNESALVFDTGRDTHNGGRLVSASGFKNALQAPDEPPILVVLNSCKSAAQLESLLGKVTMAVGMSDSIGDVDAVTFATRFYRTLAEGQSVSAAVASARADMEMNGLPDHDLPTLVTLDAVDPTKVRLIVASD